MFIPLAVAIFVPLTTFGINALHKKVVDKQNKKIDVSALKVKYSSLTIGLLIVLFVLMIGTAALFPILYLCDIPDGPPLEATVAIACCFGAAAIPCGLFLFALTRWQIGVSGEKIEFVPLFGKSREYAWEDIDFVKVYKQEYGNSIYQVFVKQKNKRAFAFTSFMAGGKLLAEKLCRSGFIHEWQL